MAKTKLTERIQEQAAALSRVRKGISGGDKAAEQIRAIYELTQKLKGKTS